MTEEIRQIIKDHGRLPIDADALSANTDLPQAGMTSHASVNVMLALEDHFDIEFPDSMLKPQRLREHRLDRGGGERAALQGGAVVSVSVDRDRAFLDAIDHIADEIAAPNADAVDREARFPAETIAALRELEGAVGVRPHRARWRRHRLRDDRRRVL